MSHIVSVTHFQKLLMNLNPGTRGHFAISDFTFAWVVGDDPPVGCLTLRPKYASSVLLGVLAFCLRQNAQRAARQARQRLATRRAAAPRQHEHMWPNNVSYSIKYARGSACECVALATGDTRPRFYAICSRSEIRFDRKLSSASNARAKFYAALTLPRSPSMKFQDLKTSDNSACWPEKNS